MVESSVKTISRPVTNRLPVDFNQLDEFACGQLDRVCGFASTWFHWGGFVHDNHIQDTCQHFHPSSQYPTY